MQLPRGDMRRDVKGSSVGLHIPDPCLGQGTSIFCSTAPPPPAHTPSAAGCGWDQYYHFLWLGGGGGGGGEELKLSVAE